MSNSKYFCELKLLMLILVGVSIFIPLISAGFGFGIDGLNMIKATATTGTNLWCSLTGCNIVGNVNITGNITANGYKGATDWITAPISITLTGTTACSNLNNLVIGYNYTCKTCVDALLGTQIACGTIVSVVENCACEVK